jgi:hypothetical protein
VYNPSVRTLPFGLLALALLGCTVRPERDAGASVDAPSRPDVPLRDVPTGSDTPREEPRDAPALDVSSDDAPFAPDAPSLDAPADAPRDAGVDVSGDAGRDAPLGDAGVAPPTIDGTIAPGEWSGAAVAADVAATIWSGNELRGLRVWLLPDALYVAVEGRIEGGNAIAVYVDRDRDEAVGVASLATVTDSMDALDAAVTADLVTPAAFRTDLIFGTLDMARSASGADPRMGWRDLVRAASLADLFWIGAGTAPVACSATACETRLPRGELGGSAPRRLGVFARIVNNDGTMSPNQTLPSDDPAQPRTVSVVLEVTE